MLLEGSLNFCFKIINAFQLRFGFDFVQFYRKFWSFLCTQMVNFIQFFSRFVILNNDIKSFIWIIFLDD